CSTRARWAATPASPRATPTTTSPATPPPSPPGPRPACARARRWWWCAAPTAAWSGGDGLPPAAPAALPPFGGLRAAAPSLPAQAWTVRRASACGAGAACKAHQRTGEAGSAVSLDGVLGEPERPVSATPFGRREALVKGLFAFRLDAARR